MITFVINVFTKLMIWTIDIMEITMHNIYLKALISISVLGAFSAGLGYLGISQVLWSVSNPLLSLHNFRHNSKEQGYLFLVFTGCAWIYVVPLLFGGII